MRLHRFIGDFDLDSKELVLHDGELVNQWRNVLRLGPSDRVILSDGKGREAEGQIIGLDKKTARVSIERVDTPERMGRKKASLFCALLKRENFELIAQKATETGIDRIVPIITARTVKTGLNKERLEKIVREAAEQSGRTTLPVVTDPVKFEEALAIVDPKEAALFDLSGSPIVGHLDSIDTVFIGPEGGFTEEEANLAREKGLQIASLGPLTLRGETAAIIASYLVVNV